jgi:hypothetical protein
MRPRNVQLGVSASLTRCAAGELRTKRLKETAIDVPGRKRCFLLGKQIEAAQQLG